MTIQIMVSDDHMDSSMCMWKGIMIDKKKKSRFLKATLDTYWSAKWTERNTLIYSRYTNPIPGTDAQKGAGGQGPVASIEVSGEGIMIDLLSACGEIVGEVFEVALNVAKEFKKIHGSGWRFVKLEGGNEELLMLKEMITYDIDAPLVLES